MSTWLGFFTVALLAFQFCPRTSSPIFLLIFVTFYINSQSSMLFPLAVARKAVARGQEVGGHRCLPPATHPHLHLLTVACPCPVTTSAPLHSGPHHATTLPHHHSGPPSSFCPPTCPSSSSTPTLPLLHCQQTPSCSSLGHVANVAATATRPRWGHAPG